VRVEPAGVDVESSSEPDPVGSAEKPVAGEDAAVVRGEVMLSWVGPPQYRDLTVVGEPMTKLFRIENECESSEIVMTRSDADEHRVFRPPMSEPDAIASGVEWWWEDDPKPVPLKGVGSTALSRLKLSGKRYYSKRLFFR